MMPEQADTLYGQIAQALRRSGYQVFAKRHPQERPGSGSDPLDIPAFFPIEAWPWVSQSRFSIAVALCSTALDTANSPFTETSLQLIKPESFARSDFSNWEQTLMETLMRSGKHFPSAAQGSR